MEAGASVIPTTYFKSYVKLCIEMTSKKPRREVVDISLILKV